MTKIDTRLNDAQKEIARLQYQAQIQQQKLTSAQQEAEKWKAEAAQKIFDGARQLLPKAATEYIQLLKARLDVWEHQFGGYHCENIDQCTSHQGCKALAKVYRNGRLGAEPAVRNM